MKARDEFFISDPHHGDVSGSLSVVLQLVLLLSSLLLRGRSFDRLASPPIFLRLDPTALSCLSISYPEREERREKEEKRSAHKHTHTPSKRRQKTGGKKVSSFRERNKWKCSELRRFTRLLAQLKSDVCTLASSISLHYSSVRLPSSQETSRKLLFCTVNFGYKRRLTHIRCM